MGTHFLSGAQQNRYNQRPSTNFLGSRGFGIRYPSPFFDVAQQFLPENVHQLQIWCRFYFLTNPVVNVGCRKMSEYSVTPIIWQTEDEQVLRLYKDVERRLRFRQFQVETGLDYNVYGNSFTSVLFGLEKYLGCRKCDMQFRARTNRSLYKWRSGRFHLRCTSCRYVGPAKQHDYYPRSVRRIRIVRWNPENIDIKHNDVTGANRYYYRLPRRIRNDIKLGDRETIETLPAPFLEAARRGKALLFKDGSIFHLKRPTVATKDMGWGSPLIYPLL